MLEPKRSEINIFTYSVAVGIIETNEDHENISIDACRFRNDWLK